MTYPWKIAGKACLIPVSFLVNGEAVIIPPATPKTVEVYTPAGTTVGITSSEFVQANSVLNVLIPDTSNATLTPTTRQVEVEFPSLGYLFKAEYKLTPRIASTVSHRDILAFIGVEEAEFPEADADYVSAYWFLLDQYPTLFATNPIAANNAVVAQTVLDSISAIRSRLWLKNTDGSISVSRSLDFEALEKRARSALGKNLGSAVAGFSDTELSTSFGSTQILFAPRTDPITGV